jgi:hypothetical protein
VDEKDILNLLTPGFIHCSDQSPNCEDSYDEPLQKVSESALLAFHSPPLDSEPDTSAPSGSFQKRKGPAHLPSLTSKQHKNFYFDDGNITFLVCLVYLTVTSADLEEHPLR